MSWILATNVAICDIHVTDNAFLCQFRPSRAAKLPHSPSDRLELLIRKNAIGKTYLFFNSYFD